MLRAIWNIKPLFFDHGFSLQTTTRAELLLCFAPRPGQNSTTFMCSINQARNTTLGALGVGKRRPIFGGLSEDVCRRLAMLNRDCPLGLGGLVDAVA
ncbi:MAG: hypothetical protein WEK74_09620, partial [Hydrogenophaga sp.]